MRIFAESCLMLKVDFKFPPWAADLEKHYQQVMLGVAATIQTNRGMLFDQEGAYNGHKRWEPLKFRAGQILSDTGTLRRSISPQIPNGRAGPGGIVKISGDVVTVGTTIKYAAIHNYGGVIRPKKAKALSWTVGKHRVFAKKVEIPARPFLDGAWNNQDQQEVYDTLKNKVARILNGSRAR
jgi:phage gpG-like protein